MNILLIGGTIFLGRHVVESALERGHTVTLFNRGMHFPELFPNVEKIQGERLADIEKLRGRSWDAVVDTCGSFPRQVRASAGLLADSVGHYTFISSLNAYPDMSRRDVDESAPVARLEDESVEEVTFETYGGLKVLCEEAAEELMPGRALNVRAGLIVGPCDFSDRFAYWPRRIAAGGEVLAPEGPDVLTQFIDVRDLADWIVHMIEIDKAGTYNTTGAPGAVTLGEVIEASRRLSGSDAAVTWVDEPFLMEQNVGPWMELPLWLPSSDPDSAGFNFVSSAKAVADGLTYRSLDDTVAATLEWLKTLPADRQYRAGLKPEREAELLRAWHER